MEKIIIKYNAKYSYQAQVSLLHNHLVLGFVTTNTHRLNQSKVLPAVQ